MNFSLVIIFILLYFVFVGEGAFGFDDLNEYTFEDSDDWDKFGSILALVEFEGQLFNCLDNWMEVNYIGKGMQKGKKN